MQSVCAENERKKKKTTTTTTTNEPVQLLRPATHDMTFWFQIASVDQAVTREYFRFAW